MIYIFLDKSEYRRFVPWYWLVIIIFEMNETPQIFQKQIPHCHHSIFGVDDIFWSQQPHFTFSVPQRIERFKHE
jgi:hypothetical protein